jgi:hypothetical protein
MPKFAFVENMNYLKCFQRVKEHNQCLFARNLTKGDPSEISSGIIIGKEEKKKTILYIIQPTTMVCH